MSNFGLSQDKQELFQLAKDFSEKEVWPKARYLDETSEFPTQLLTKAHQLGLLNSFVPVEVGGLGLGTLDHCLLSEAFSMGSAGFSTAAIANELAGIPVVLSENHEMWKKYLAPMVDGAIMASYCVTEPGAGSDVANIKTTAKKEKDGYVIQGSKMWITNAGHASWFFVLARTGEAGPKGLTGFIVPADAPGIQLGKKEKTMGQRCSDTRGVTFDNVFIPANHRLGDEGKGFKLAMGAFDKTRPAVASGAVGLAQRAFQCSVDYSTQRMAFGKPIVENQGISFMLADMAKDIEASRILAWKAGAQADEGQSNVYFASIAKLMASEMVMKVTTDAVQVYGGYGYSQEYPVEMLMRDAKIFQIYEGTSQIQRMIIAREILKK